MSQLIHIRQRVKAIETIKKITHAMRLISMSAHSRLKHKEAPLTLYSHAIRDLFFKLTSVCQNWRSPLLQPSPNTPERNLIIIISSQKGLCGSFNSMLFSLFKKKSKELPKSADYIVIGKKAMEFIRNMHNKNIISAFPTFTNKNRSFIAHSIVELLVTQTEPYTHVIVLSNKLKTFFVQKPSISTLIPLSTQKMSPLHTHEDYLWEQQQEDILHNLSLLYLESTIENILFQSLFSEHASRFVSMDTATRNAENLLEVTRIKYNKLRQAKITKELAELSGSNQS